MLNTIEEASFLSIEYSSVKVPARPGARSVGR
jgi:hypothetical protein